MLFLIRFEKQSKGLPLTILGSYGMSARLEVDGSIESHNVVTSAVREVDLVSVPDQVGGDISRCVPKANH